jgi:hypothetical protein
MMQSIGRGCIKTATAAQENYTNVLL